MGEDAHALCAWSDEAAVKWISGRRERGVVPEHNGPALGGAGSLEPEATRLDNETMGRAASCVPDVD